MTPKERAERVATIHTANTFEQRAQNALRSSIATEIEMAVAEEREACARVVEDFEWPDAHDLKPHAAAAIRSRA